MSGIRLAFSVLMPSAKTGFTLPYAFTALEGKAALHGEMPGISQVCATDEVLVLGSSRKKKAGCDPSERAMVL